MPFDEDYVYTLAEDLRAKGVRFEAGLTDEEIHGIEGEYAFSFPPDLRLFLQFALPVSEDFPNWRTGFVLHPMVEWQGGVAVARGHNLIPISQRLDWPAEGSVLTSSTVISGWSLGGRGPWT
jgi:hypothetical protein